MFARALFWSTLILALSVASGATEAWSGVRLGTNGTPRKDPVYPVVHNPAMEEQPANRTVYIVRNLVIGVADSEDANDMLGEVYDIAVDSKCNVYAVDHGFARVQKFDSLGNFSSSIGRSGEGPGEYRSPSAVAVDENDNVYVASQGRVSVFDASGAYLRQVSLGLSGFVRKVRVVDAGIYVSCFDLLDQKIIHRYSFPDGALLQSFCDSYAVGQEVDTRIESVLAGGTLDARAGVIYFSQISPYEIRVFSISGELLRVVLRDNDFMYAPRVESRGDGMRFGPFAMSVGIVVMGNGWFANTIIVPGKPNSAPDTVIDLFDESGRLVASTRLNGSLPIKCRDRFDRLYAYAMDDFPRIERFAIVLK